METLGESLGEGLFYATIILPCLGVILVTAIVAVFFGMYRLLGRILEQLVMSNQTESDILTEVQTGRAYAKDREE